LACVDFLAWVDFFARGADFLVAFGADERDDFDDADDRLRPPAGLADAVDFLDLVADLVDFAGLADFADLAARLVDFAALGDVREVRRLAAPPPRCVQPRSRAAWSSGSISWVSGS